MRRPRTDKSARKRRRRSRGTVISQFVRGLVLEGIGVAALVFLYFTIQTSSASRTMAEENVIEGITHSDSVAAEEFAAGSNASSWAEYNRRTRSRVNQSGAIGSTMWSGSSNRW